MNLWPSAKDLAGLPGMPADQSGVWRMAKREGWTTKKQPVRGGQMIRYAIESLPPETRTALALRNVSSADTQTAILAPGLLAATVAGAQVREARQGSDSAAGTARVANVTGKQAQERDDKLRLLVLFRRFWDTLGGPLCPAMEAFCKAWGDGRIDAPPALRERFPTLRRWKTVLEWWTGLDRHGAAALTRPPSHRAGRFEVLEGELGQIVLAVLHDYPHLGATQIRRLVAKSCQFAQLTDASLPSDRAFRRVRHRHRHARAGHRHPI